MWKTKEESGCFIVESNTRLLCLPFQISGLVLISAALVLVSVCRPFAGCFLALIGGCLMAIGAKLWRSSEYLFDPYMKKVFWKQKEGAQSRIGSVSFQEITHVLLEKNQEDSQKGLSLLLFNEKMPLLSQANAVKKADDQSLEELAKRIRQIVGSY
ncbi:MAG: hypothetical protein LCH63_15535 [Candidatus Melainabacteria bacterium]|jgi:flagellar biosynthesis component FlhA|nr:hypothetical protein [Candidatus Melainabacteria bacterium]